MQEPLLEGPLEVTPKPGFGLVYKITLRSGKSYIGKTTQKLKYRINSHIGQRNACRYFSRALNKYGLRKSRMRTPFTHAIRVKAGGI